MTDLSDDDLPDLEEIVEPLSGVENGTQASNPDEISSAVVLHPTLATAEAIDAGSTASGSYAAQKLNGRYRGLSNQGATCYLNSLLQSLYMTPEFRAGLYEWTYDEAKDGPKEDCIPYQLQSLFGRMQLSKQGVLDTKALTASFGWGSAEAFQQQDVQELCRVLFDRLEEAFKHTPNANLVNDLYQGRMVDYLETIGYKYTSNHPSEFLDISLQVKPFGSDKCFRSVDESLRSFLAPEKLEGDNQYYCEEADAKFDAIKGFRLEKLPYLLTLQLKRFDLDYATLQRVKLNDQVRFPRVLNMNPFVATAAASDPAVSGDSSRAASDPMDGDASDGSSGAGAAASSSSSEPTSPRSGGSGGGQGSGDRLAFEQGVLLERERLLSSSPPPSSSDSTAAVLSSSSSSDNLDLPELVDVSGVTHPDVAAEAAAAAAAKASEIFAEDDEEVDPIRLVERDGEWVYELYAVLIHSGSALGGHYYAYIKEMVPGSAVVPSDTPTAAAAAAGASANATNDDDEDKDLSASPQQQQPGWYHFNDASVTSMSSAGVRQAWGGHGGSGSKGAYGANAYMLMYRKVDPSRNKPAPGDEAVPSYIVEACKQAEAEALAQQELKALRDRQLHFKVILAGTETEVSVHHDKFSSVRSLKIATANTLGIRIQGDSDNGLTSEGEAPPGSSFSSSVAAPSPVATVSPDLEPSVQAAVETINSTYAACGGAALSDLRLREVSLSWKVPTKPLNSEAIESGTLAQATLYSHQKLCLEVAPRPGGGFPDDGWVEGGIWVQVSKYDPNLPSDSASDSEGGSPLMGALAEPVSVCISKAWTVGDARVKIAAACGIANPSRCRILKNLTYSTAVPEIYVVDDKVISTCYWYEGMPLWCEELPEGESDGVGEPSDAPVLSQRAYERASAKLPLSFTRLGETEVTEHLMADARWTVATLRKKIATQLGIAPLLSQRKSLKKEKEKGSTKEVISGSDDDDEQEEKENAKDNAVANVETNEASDVENPTKEAEKSNAEEEEEEEKEEEEYDFRIKVVGQAKEIKGTKNTTLKQVTMYKDMKLQLCRGRPTQPGEYYWKCFLFGPSTAVKGALPAIAPEPSPEELRDYLASADGAIADIAEDGASSVEGAAAAVTSPISGESTESVEGAVSRNSNSSGGEQKEEATALEETKETKDADDNAEEPPSTFGFDFVIDQPSVFDFNSNFFEVLVRPSMPVSEFRRALWSQLIERGLISKPPSTTRSGNEGDGERDDDDDDEEGFKRVRVREKAHHRATKVFRDGKTLIDVVPNFYENKEIAVQMLDAPERLAPEGSPQHGMIAWVRRWHRSTQSLGPPQEVLVRASEPLLDFNARLGCTCGVSHPKHARVLRVPPYTAMKLQDLSAKKVNDSLANLQGVFYNYYAAATAAAVASPDSPCTVSHAMLNLQELNTDMLVVMDISEPLNPLTPSQQRSLDLAQSATNSSTSTAMLGNNPLYSNFSDPWPSQTGIASYPSSTSTYLRSGGVGTNAAAAKPKEFGVRIKTRQEREADATAASSNNGTSGISMSGLTLPPLPPTASSSTTLPLSGGASAGSASPGGGGGGAMNDADLWTDKKITMGKITIRSRLPSDYDASMELD